MSDLAKLKKKAADLEQRRQFDKALAVYEEMLLAQEGSDDADVSLLNRVGDLRLRLGRTIEALDAYERAVELYVERGFLNNAIALCNKILRQDPTRSDVHYRLGRISAEKGFRSDARRHFLDYAGLMQLSGRLDEAFAALAEFADLSPENADVRLMLAEQLARHDRTDEAIAQLTILLDRYEAEHRHADAHDVAERIRALDPAFSADEHHAVDHAPDMGGPFHGHTPAQSHTPPRGGLGGVPELVFIDPSDVTAIDPTDMESPDEPAAAASDDIEPLDLVPSVGTAGDGMEPHERLIRDAALEMVEGLTPTAEEEAALPGGMVPTLDGLEATEFAASDLAPVDLTAMDVAPTGFEQTGFEQTGFETTRPGAAEIDPVEIEATGSEAVEFGAVEFEAVEFEAAPFEPGALEVIGLDALETEAAADDAGTEAFELLSSDELQPEDDATSSLTFETEPTILEIPVDDASGATGRAAGPFESMDPGAADAVGGSFPAMEDARQEPTFILPELTPAVTHAGDEGEVAGAAEDDGSFINLGDLLRADDGPRSTRMITEERAPSGDEQADFAEMLRKFKQGVAENVDDEDYDSHHDLGVAYREMGLVDEAIAAFQRALRGTPNRVRTYEALGQCFLDREQYAVASSVLQRALAEPGADDERLVGVLYLLGRAAEAMNQRNEALSYYQRVFAVDIEFADVASRMELSGTDAGAQVGR